MERSGANHRADWAWVYEVHDGPITRILAIEDLAGVADEIRAVVSRAQSGTSGRTGVASG